MESSTPEPAWRSHRHLIAGVIVVLFAMTSVLFLHIRTATSREQANSVVSLAFDQSEAIQSNLTGPATTALHLKLLDAIDTFGAPEKLAVVRAELEASWSATLEAEPANRARYGSALRAVVRTTTFEADLARVRTQQVQMGIVAAAAITLILIIRSVAAQRQSAVRPRRALAHPSQIDPVTGLGRIDAIRDRLNELLDPAAPKRGFVGLLAVGIQPEHEHFLPLSRAQLDTALAETARRLRDTVRSTDVVARLARDELAVALPPAPRVEDPGRVASKVLGVLDQPILVDGVTVRPNPRVGIAISPLDAATADGLIQRSRLARRAASDSPAPVYRSYNENLAPTEMGTLQIVEDLRSALDADDGQLWVAYQPKIDLTNERVVGFEALARWSHPQLGNIPPSDFIPAAEETDLIIDLGAWVLDEVCAQLAAWRSNLTEPIPVSVNVSGRQFENGGLAEIVRATLDAHGVPAALLELELTEGVLLDDRADLVTMMKELSDLGVKIAVDDFGTGYSALSYLKRFPIDVLKIDRAFIREIHGDDSDEAISTAIIDMAHRMALTVVAEGVETPEQLSVLRNLGCDAAQGFYFAHPAHPADIEHRAIA